MQIQCHFIWGTWYTKICGFQYPWESWDQSPMGTEGWLCCCWCLVAKSYPTLLRHHGLQPTRLLCPWDFPGKSTEVGCPFLLRGSSQPRDQTCISCTAGRFFTTEPPGKDRGWPYYALNSVAGCLLLKEHIHCKINFFIPPLLTKHLGDWELALSQVWHLMQCLSEDHWRQTWYRSWFPCKMTIKIHFAL